MAFEVALKMTRPIAIIEGNRDANSPGSKLGGVRCATLIVSCEAGYEVAREADVETLGICARLQKVDIPEFGNGHP